MPATPGEQQLLAQLAKLATGQAAGSFGPSQALALLSGYVKLRDRVDEHGVNLQAAMDNITALQTALADATARTTTLETNLGALTLRVTALENPPPAA